MSFRLLCAAFAFAMFTGSAWSADDEPPPKLTNEPWKNTSRGLLSSQELDQLIAGEQAKQKIAASPKITDEQFVRRVMLDLTGRLPLPADVTEFIADKDPSKRAKLIDRLLASEEYADHWSKYWRDVFTAKVSDMRGRAISVHFEAWLKDQFNKNRTWDQMAREMLTASGQLPVRLGRGGVEPDAKNGAAYFLLSYQGQDAIHDRTAETSRIFLGIQIQCAQCHDHPFDGWKREQFHELAGYFARLADRPVFERVNERRQIVGVTLQARPFGEHSMPGKDDPGRGTQVRPKFLDGSSPRIRASDSERRKSLANVIASPDNYWFAAAFVNRLWGELMGQAFRQPIDDMGPGKEVVMPDVLARVSASFAGNGFDIKQLLRTICNSDTYQRQIRPGESPTEHLQFAGINPTRLRSESLWQSLTTVLGSLGPPAPQGGNPFARRFSVEGQFKDEFSFDPSLPPDEVESSIPQALMLMNNPTIQRRIRAQGTNLLARILSSYSSDEEALRIVYLRTLSRKPTDGEQGKALAYIKKVGNRAEAFEDLLWALLNSTEFQTRR